MYSYSSYGFGSSPYSTSPLSGYSMSSLPSYSRLPALSRTSFYTPYQDLTSWQTTKSLHVPPRPIRMDTADIDVSGPRKVSRPVSGGGSTLSTSGVIHRGRSVVRLQSRREKCPQKSPGAMLAEKFMIKERKTSPKLTSFLEDEKKEHVFRTRPRDLAPPQELCKIVVEEPNGREREIDLDEEIENKSRCDDDDESGQSDGEQGTVKSKQRPIKKVIKRPPGFAVRESSGLNVLQESEEESDSNKAENVEVTLGNKSPQTEEPKKDEPVVETEVAFCFKKKKKPVVVPEVTDVDEAVTESFTITLSPGKVKNSNNRSEDDKPKEQSEKKIDDQETSTKTDEIKDKPKEKQKTKVKKSDENKKSEDISDIKDKKKTNEQTNKDNKTGVEELTKKKVADKKKTPIG